MDEKRFETRKMYPAMAQKTGMEFFIGTTEDKYGNKVGRGFIRIFDYEKRRQNAPDGQIVVMLDPAEFHQIAKAIAFAISQKKTVQAIEPHKFGEKGNETMTMVYVDAREVTDTGKDPRVFYGFTITRKKGNETVTLRVPVLKWKFEYLSTLLKEWSVQSAFTDRLIKGIPVQAGASTGSSMDDAPLGPGDIPDAGTGDFLDEVPF